MDPKEIAWQDERAEAIMAMERRAAPLRHHSGEVKGATHTLVAIETQDGMCYFARAHKSNQRVTYPPDEHNWSACVAWFVDQIDGQD